MPRLKVLALTRYTNIGASSRLRFYQFRNYLEVHGLKVDIAPLFDDNYLTTLYADSGTDWPRVAKAYVKRISALWHTKKYDLVWLEYEALPWLPTWMEMVLGLSRVPYVVDYDDAIFHRYDLHHNRLIRFILGRKIDRIMEGSQLVIVGNQYLAERALSVGAKRVEILPTVVDATRYQPQYNAQPGVVTIGWIGSPSTQSYLDIALGALTKLSEMGKQIRLVVVGGNLKVQANLSIVNIQWSEAGEVGAIQSFDVGVMPLLDSPWERGKCGYKLIQYMACGKPVVASPVGVNREIVEHGINGFLAGDEEEWVSYLLRLIEDPLLRMEMGRKGRAKMVAEFSLELASPRLLALMRSAAN
jgi:glycosyltransferase involved in cell wall biosynthesis